MNSLYSHQVTGVEWLAPRRRALLADGMGSGKSITAIVAAAKAGVKSILVLAPTVVAFNWLREFQRWAPERKAMVFSRGDQFEQAMDDSIGADVLITTHGLTIQQHVHHWLRRKWDLVILDESHFFRNESAQRTRAFYGTKGLIHWAQRVWLLTGTPMVNNASELWPMLRGLWPDRCPWGFEEFRERFCETVWNPFSNDYKVIGNKNVAELKALMNGIVLRRLTKDHLNLPPVRIETMVLQPAHVPQRLLELNKAFAGHPLDTILDFIRASTYFSEWRHLCGLAKMEATVDLLAMELEGTGHKVLVAAHHLDVLAGVESGLRSFGVVRFTGKETGQQRETNKQRFQTDPSCRVALCQIIAGGVGTTLTAAADVVMIEQDWSPENNAQLIARCARIGQTLPVRVRLLALANTVDELVTEANARKSGMIAEVLGEKSEK